MSEQHKSSNSAGDGFADALAATGVIAILVATVAFWLSGFPT